MKYNSEECLGSRVRGLSRKIDNIYRKHLGDYPVTENQLSIMMALHKTGTVEQNRIAKLLNLEKSTLSRNLVRLIKSGLIDKSGVTNRPKIGLTKQGQKRVESLIPIWEAAMDEIHAVLSWHDLKGFQQFESKISLL
ncbi:MarR family winged helix-turn-helix transcriptional regulator [Flagellimonas myxillae]|uniref:MarR family winged helix-turn-helix transcriptional regulator n=1 Tax=Flagellimonas myxillae TaxID=2942214 RepID=UPI00201EEA2F|nr:MarR family winged helix-turn-helix transcriptional regulator [Muricauda myxillae]MCL6266478.1 MarR family winged helix-turn-helix transcriptional regulator [Muricauda myxillae]